MEEQIYQIYDRIFKRIFTLSNLAIVNMINGLFYTNYPPDSTVTYPNKEFINTMLKKRIADMFVTINGTHTYHLEAQIQKDNNIVLRVIDYGFQYALANSDDEINLRFPEPMVIYLSNENNIPEESVIYLDFGTQGKFEYRVKNFVYLKHDTVELNQRKLVILIPFQLLHLKEIIHKKPTRENFLKLQELIQHDILESVEANLKVGNITLEDANQLRELTRQLYDHLYVHYYEIGGCEDMKPLLEGALELPMDKYRIRIDELERENERIRKEAEEKAKKTEEQAKKTEELYLKEIESLRKKIQELQK